MLDHVVYIASDLDQAVEDHRRQGFTVTTGGEHAGGVTHNALISLADGSYVELVGFRRPDPSHRWWRHAAHGGFADFACSPMTSRRGIRAERSRRRSAGKVTHAARRRVGTVSVAFFAALRS